MVWNRTGELTDVDHRVVTVLGDLDQETAGHLECDVHGMVAAGFARLVLNLSRLRVCDGAAMAALARMSRHCAEHGGWLRIAAPTGMVATAFAVVAFGRTVPVYATVRAAIAGDEDQRIKD